MPSLIFDLDQTLVDSSSAANHRDNRLWSQVYNLIPQFTVYDGLEAMFKYIRDEELQVCIITTSPALYCQKVLEHWSIPYHHKICYHDVQHRKPHPEAFLKAISLLGDKPSNILSLGDRSIDIQASRAAGIKSVGCLWGTTEREQVIAEAPEYIAITPLQALSIIKSFNNE